MKLSSFTESVALAMLLLALISAGCGGKAFRQCIPENLEQRILRVSYTEKSDVIFEGPSALAYSIRIENLTSNPLTNVKLNINGKWSADLKELRAVEIEGRKQEGTARIPPMSRVLVTLNHDITNHLLFKDSEGKTMPSTTRFERIEVQHSEGGESFKFESRN